MTVEAGPVINIGVLGAQGENILDTVRRLGLGGCTATASDETASVCLAQYISDVANSVDPVDYTGFVLDTGNQDVAGTKSFTKPIVQHATAYHDPSIHSNGNLSSSFTTDNGVTATMFSFTSDVAAYSSGKITYSGATNPLDGNTHAFYIQMATGQRVTRMKCETNWPASSGGCAVVFVVPSAAWTSGSLAAPAGIHFVFYGNGQWHVSEWDGAAENIYASSDDYGRYADQTDGVTRSIEMFIDTVNSELTVFFPDGSYLTIADSSIAAETSTYGIFEMFVSSASPSVAMKIGKMTVDSNIRNFDSPTIDRRDIAKTRPRTVVFEYTSQGNNTEDVPQGTIGCFVDLIAPGGGGGSGRRGAAGTVRTGGSAGGAGGVLKRQWVPAENLGTTFDLNIGAAGVGGAAVTANSTNGNDGTDAAICLFSSTPASGPVTKLRVLGGGKGHGGSTTAATGGNGGSPNALGGGDSDGSGGAGPAGGLSVNGGVGQSAAGGGISSGDTAANGGAGSSAYLHGADTGGTAGVVGGASPGGGTAAQAGRPGDGAGGGAASTSGAAQAGANGVGYGAGGGGGGASANGNNSGKGGDGAPGYGRVEFLFG